ncbi:MAG: hypothetical protein U9Q74_08650 [Gemmatimonadota bacterium]|nr:hypothetical protein [Gemmatimonadota bacterium]
MGFSRYYAAQTPGLVLTGEQRATLVRRTYTLVLACVFITLGGTWFGLQNESILVAVAQHPIITMLLSFGAAAVWFAYTSLSPSSEGYDFLTPAVIAGTPLMLRVLQKPLDKLLGPLYKLLNALPRPLLVGAALAVPVVLGGIFTRAVGGYGGLRRSAFVSVILGYILTRRPESIA